MLAIGPRLDGKLNILAAAQHVIEAAVHVLFPGHNDSVAKGVLQHGGVIVPAAVLVDEKVLGLRAAAHFPGMTHQLLKTLAEHCSLAAPVIDQFVEPLGANDHAADQAPGYVTFVATVVEAIRRRPDFVELSDKRKHSISPVPCLAADLRMMRGAELVQKTG